MARSFELLVCVLDVGRSMSATEFSPTRLSIAKDAVELLIQQKMFHTKRDEVGVVLFGTDDTCNEVHDEVGEGYEHVTTLCDLKSKPLDVLREVRTVRGTQQQGDFLDGIVVALSMIHKRMQEKTRGYSMRGRIFLLTDAASPVADVEQVDDAIMSQFRGAGGIKLDVVGVDFGEATERARHKTDVKRANEQLLTRMATQLNSHVVPAGRAIEIMSAMRARSVAPTTKMRDSLIIGKDAAIPIWTYARTAEAKIPSLSKRSVFEGKNGDDDEEEEEEDQEEAGGAAAGAGGIGRKAALQQLTAGAKVSRQLDYVDPSSQLPVAAEERVRAYRYGKELLPVSAEDEKALKLETDRGMQLLGFVAADQVQRHYFISTVDLVLPEPGNSQAATAISALARALHKEGRVAVVRYVKRKNSAPALGILSPQLALTQAEADWLGEPKTDTDCLYFNQLPFAEDIRTMNFHSFEADDSIDVSAADAAAADALVASLDLTSADEAGNVTEELKPISTFNPAIQRFYQLAIGRAHDPNAPVPALPAAVAQYMQPDPARFSAAAPAIDSFKAAFPVKRVDKAAGKKRRFEDATGVVVAGEEAEEAEAGVAAASAAKKGRGDARAALDGLMGRNLVEEIGTVDPAGDFAAMTARRDKDLGDKAVAGITAVIRRMVSDRQSHDRALECLRAMRKGCLHNYDEDRFNDFLQQFRGEIRGVAGAAGALWEAIVAAGITLVTEDESDRVEVTKAEAEAFLRDEPAVAPAPAPVVAVAEPEDDDFDDMD